MQELDANKREDGLPNETPVVAEWNSHIVVLCILSNTQKKQAKSISRFVGLISKARGRYEIWTNVSLW